MSYKKSKQDLISVIMPIYNSNINYLKQSINSILNQDYPFFELIIIMDKTNKNIDSYIIKLINKFYSDKIRLIINSEKKGIVNSINLGISFSNGEYIARMDDDDISKSNRFSEQIKYLKKHHLDFIGSWVEFISNDNYILLSYNTPINEEEINNYMLVHNPFIHSTLLFKKEILIKTGLYNANMRHSQDYELFMRLINKGYKPGNIPQYLVQIRENPNSLTRKSAYIKTRLDYIRIKFLGIVLYRYRKPKDILFFFISFFSLVMDMKILFSFKLLFQRITKFHPNS